MYQQVAEINHCYLLGKLSFLAIFITEKNKYNSLIVMELIEQIKVNAKRNRKRIVLPESHDERTIRAADIALQQGLADITLIGNRDRIFNDAKAFGLANINKAFIVDPEKNDKTDAYVDLMVKIREKKGLTREAAVKLLKDPTLLGWCSF